MNKYQAKQGVSLPINKVFGSLGFCKISQETPDSFIAQTMGNGGEKYFEEVPKTQAENQDQNILKSKKDGKAKPNTGTTTGGDISTADDGGEPVKGGGKP